MRTRCALVALLVLAACNTGPVDSIEPVEREAAVEATAGPSPSPSSTPTPSEPDKPKPFAPAPDKALSFKPGKLASKLVKVTDALKASVTRWRRSGEARPPKVVILQTLYQQRIYRLMGKRAKLGNRTVARLDGMLGRSAAGITEAHRLLRSLVQSPLEPGFEFKTGRKKPARELLDYYKRAERRFDVDWQVLAAVNYVETKFGKVKATSSAGAQGPMQFLPSTWEAYGMGGNIRDDRDAIMGAANYLRASGAGEGKPGLRRALFAYNRSDAYVQAVINFAKDIKRRSRHYFAFYNWQVYVVTTRGDKRLTGPGL
ncbi:MAG: lytic transglycosylase domain-containing protein [Actinomycetota bacterium]|nr:lytic transglycosylase domain-containing protein [Actinomycetota bacterium]